jgi:glycosyltransferase involved in cell wall biosynthesis
MIKNFLVSVIIPVYNTGIFLEKCLESVINQTYSFLEIIVVNDGSTDGSGIIIDKYYSLDKRFVVINQNNSGLSSSRNVGVSSCTGDYVVFVDSDDWIENNFIECLLREVSGHDLVICSYMREFRGGSSPRILDDNGKINANDFKRKLIGPISTELKDPSAIDNLVTAWAKMYNTGIVKNNSIMFVSTKEIGTEDLLFNLMYCSQIRSVFVVNKPLYHYRKYNSNSLTTVYKKDLFRLWKKLQSLIMEIIDIDQSIISVAYGNRVAFSFIGLGLNEIKNPDGFFYILYKLDNILKDQAYSDSFQRLSFIYLPIHWMLFFFCCKKRYTFILYIMLKVMSFIIDKKN